MYVSTWKTCVNCYPGFYQEFFNFCIFNIGIQCTVPVNIRDHKCIVTMLNLNWKPFCCKCYCASLIFNHLEIKYPYGNSLMFLNSYISKFYACVNKKFYLFSILNENSDLYGCTKHTYTSRYAADLDEIHEWIFCLHN